MSLSKSLCDCLALKPAKLFFQEEDLMTGMWDQPEKAMAAHSSALAWKIPWTEEPGGLQSMGSWRVGHDRATSLALFTFMHWRRNWQPTPVFLPGESQGRGSLVGCRLWGRTESDTAEATQQQCGTNTGSNHCDKFSQVEPRLFHQGWGGVDLSPEQQCCMRIVWSDEPT